MESALKSPAVLIQHKCRLEVKQWIEQEAAKQERSQGWIANRILEEAYTRAQQTQGVTQ